MICSPIGTTFHQGFPDRVTQSDSSLVSCLCSTTGGAAARKDLFMFHRRATGRICKVDLFQGCILCTRTSDLQLPQGYVSPRGGLPGRKKELVIKMLYKESYYSHGRNLKYCLRVQFTW